MKLTIDAISLASILGNLKLGDAIIRKNKKTDKKEDLVNVVLSAQNNRLRIQLITFDSVLTSYNSAAKCWDAECDKYTITVEIEAHIIEEGAYSLTLSQAKKIAKVYTRGDVGLLTSGASLEVTQGQKKTHIAIESANHVSFPDVCDGILVPKSTVLEVICSTSVPDDTLNCLHQWVAVQSSPRGTSVSWTDDAQMFWRRCDPDIASKRMLIPVFALECLKALKPADEVVEVKPDGIRCGNVCVEYLEQTPDYPSTIEIITGMNTNRYSHVKTTCEDVRSMLKQLSSCTDDLVVMSASNGRLRMLSYNDKHGKCKDWQSCPRAETWTDAETEGGFAGIGLHVPRLKRALGKYTGPVTFHIEDSDSPVFIDIENSGIKTALMPRTPTFSKTSID